MARERGLGKRGKKCGIFLVGVGGGGPCVSSQNRIRISIRKYGNSEELCLKFLYFIFYSH